MWVQAQHIHIKVNGVHPQLVVQSQHLLPINRLQLTKHYLLLIQEKKWDAKRTKRMLIDLWKSWSQFSDNVIYMTRLKSLS